MRFGFKTRIWLGHAPSITGRPAEVGATLGDKIEVEKGVDRLDLCGPDPVEGELDLIHVIDGRTKRLGKLRAGRYETGEHLEIPGLVARACAPRASPSSRPSPRSLADRRQTTDRHCPVPAPCSRDALRRSWTVCTRRERCVTRDAELDPSIGRERSGHDTGTASGWLLGLVVRRLAGRRLSCGAARSAWFDAYSERFDTVEFNNTFYRLPPISTVERWAAQAPAGFLYAIKTAVRLTPNEAHRRPVVAAQPPRPCRTPRPSCGTESRPATATMATQRGTDRPVLDHRPRQLPLGPR